MDEKEFANWINSFHTYVNCDDGVLIVMASPDDMKKVEMVIREVFNE
jgi:hypothetical protein